MRVLKSQDCVGKRARILELDPSLNLGLQLFGKLGETLKAFIFSFSKCREHIYLAGLL